MRRSPFTKRRGANKNRPGGEQKTPTMRLCLIYLAKVTILQQKNCSPPRVLAVHKRRYARPSAQRDQSLKRLFADLGNAMRKPRNFAARCIAVNDAVIGSTDQCRFGFGHSSNCGGAIASRDCFFHFAHCRANASPTPLVDLGAASDLASGFLCRLCIGHKVLNDR